MSVLSSPIRMALMTSKYRLQGNLISTDANDDSIRFHDGITSTISSTFTAPDGGNLSVAYDPVEGNLISQGTINDKIYVHSGLSSTVTESFSSAALNSPSVVVRGRNLITLSNDVYIHSGISSTVTSSFAAPNSGSVGSMTLSPSGDLVIAANNVAIIYIMVGQTSTVRSTFTAPSSDTKGLASDGIRLVSVDDAISIFSIHQGFTSTIVTTFTVAGLEREMSMY